MILNELISNIQTYFNNGVKSDDYILSDRLIYKELLSTRSVLLYQKILKLKGHNIGDNNFDVINCIELIEVDSANCPCVPAKGCLIKRSKYKLPLLLATAYGDYIEYVRSIDGRIKFDKSSLSEQEDKQYREYGKHANEYFFESGYLWVYTSEKFSDLKYIRIKAIFEDPMEVNEFKRKNNCDCDIDDIACTSYDLEFKIDKELVKLLTDTVITNIFKYYLITGQDTKNNSISDLLLQNRNQIQKNSNKDKEAE